MKPAYILEPQDIDQLVEKAVEKVVQQVNRFKLLENL